MTRVRARVSLFPFHHFQTDGHPSGLFCWYHCKGRARSIQSILVVFLPDLAANSSATSVKSWSNHIKNSIFDTLFLPLSFVVLCGSPQHSGVVHPSHTWIYPTCATTSNWGELTNKHDSTFLGWSTFCFWPPTIYWTSYCDDIAINPPSIQQS